MKVWREAIISLEWSIAKLILEVSIRARAPMGMSMTTKEISIRTAAARFLFHFNLVISQVIILRMMIYSVNAPRKADKKDANLLAKITPMKAMHAIKAICLIRF